MIQEYQIRVLPVVASSEQNIRQFVAEDKGIDVRTINAVRVLKRSIDARQRTIFINLTVRVYINELPQDDEYVSTEYGDVSSKPAVVVVGEGPGGLFASLRLIELGLRPIVLERGKNVRDRKVDLANIQKTQKVDPESNYCFGEGGAGAYSDGKLYTRSKKRGNIEKILNVFCQHGAHLLQHVLFFFCGAVELFGYLPQIIVFGLFHLLSSLYAKKFWIPLVERL